MPVAASKWLQGQAWPKVPAAERLAPFVPSPPEVVEQMLEVAAVGSSDRLYDLGSGDGRIVMIAAQKFGAQAVGVELDPGLVKRSSDHIFALGLEGRARIVHGNMLDADLRGATVVTLYQLTRANERLRPLLERQLLPGSRVVSLDFPVLGWEPQRLITGVLKDGSPHAIYLYSMGLKKEKAMPITADKRGYTAGRYAIELDGLFGGWVSQAGGGNATADVITEKLGPDGVIRKHIAGLKYEDISINCGTGMSKGFYEWIRLMLELKASRKDGAVVATDYNYSAVSRLEFHQALISEVGFPALDAASKDTAQLTIKIAPEYTRRPAGAASSASFKSAGAAKIQKKWLSSNFRLTIGSLDCSKVSKIDALTIRQAVMDNPVGESRDYEKEPAHLEIPNLAITLAESHAQDFYDWHEDFVIKGNCGQDKEKNGTIEMLSPDLKEVLFTLTLKQLGIFRLAPESSEAGSEAIRRVRVEMYCEEMDFDYSGAVSEASQTTPASAPPPSPPAELLQSRLPIGATLPAALTTSAGPSLRFRT